MWDVSCDKICEVGDYKSKAFIVRCLKTLKRFEPERIEVSIQIGDFSMEYSEENFIASVANSDIISDFAISASLPDGRIAIRSYSDTKIFVLSTCKDRGSAEDALNSILDAICKPAMTSGTSFHPPGDTPATKAITASGTEEDPIHIVSRQHKSAIESAEQNQYAEERRFRTTTKITIAGIVSNIISAILGAVLGSILTKLIS